MRRFWHLIWYKAMAELKAENTRHYAGYLWWILTPILHLGVYYIIFSWFRKQDENYVAFLFIGIVAYNWFSGSSTAKSGCGFGSYNNTR